MSPTGTVTFTLTNGAGTVLYTSPAEALTATGTPGTYTAQSPGYTATATGTDYWVASFGGDGNNSTVSSGTAAEPVNVDAISTGQQPASATVGTSIATRPRSRGW